MTMSPTTRNFLIATAASLSFSRGLLAQSRNTSSLEGCSQSIQSIARGGRANSTGSLAMNAQTEINQPDEEWYLSMMLRDNRHEGSDAWEFEPLQNLQVFLSVPEVTNGSRGGNTPRMCAYRLEGVNATADGSNFVGPSCDGVLSDECRIELEREFPLPEGDRCPVPPDPSELCGTGPRRSSRKLNPHAGGFQTPR